MKGLQRVAAAALATAPAAFLLLTNKEKQQQQQQQQQQKQKFYCWRKPLFSSVALCTEQQQQQKQQQQKNQQQKVLIWGSRLSFPGGAPSDVQTPTEAETLNCLATSWVAVSFGPHFGAAIPGDGRSCVVWGSLEQEDGEPAFVSPFVLPLPQGAAPATDVQCSATEIFVLDRDGRIYVIDDALSLLQQQQQQHQQQQQLQQQHQQLFRQLKGLPVKGFFSGDFIAKMAVGANHAAFISQRGRLFCCGDNLYGQCGLKPSGSRNHHVAMHEVFLPEKAKAAGAACGDRHTIVLATDGSTFAFGDDSKIQLAIGDTRAPGGADVETTKQPGMDMAQDKAPVQRAVTYGVLDRHIQHEPIPSLKPPAAVSPEAALGLATAVAASDFSSIILYQRGDAATGAPVNSLLCCGETTRGQCGRTLQQQQQTLLPVQLPRSLSPPFVASFVSDVSCGSSHCVAALNHKTLVAWGINSQGQVGAGHRGIVTPARCVRLPWEVNVSSEETKKMANSTGKDTDTNIQQMYIAKLSCGFSNSAVILDPKR